MKKTNYKYSILLLIASLILTSIQTFSFATNSTKINADVNLDGYVDLKDVLSVRRMVRRVDAPTQAGDVNGDGNVTALDVFLIREYISNAHNGVENLSLTIYSISQSHFQGFLNNIALETITEDPRLVSANKITYYSHDYDDSMVEDLIKGTTETYTDWDGIRLGKYYNMPIYKRHIEYLRNTATLTQLFAGYGITVASIPRLVCMIDSENMMPITWVKCGENNYFLEFIENPDGDYKNWLSLRPYTEDEYLYKMTAQKAELTINGTAVEDEYAYVTSIYGTVSLTKVLLGLGANITWTNDNNAIAVVNGKNLYIDVENNSISNSFNGNNIMVVPGGSGIMIPVEKDIVIDDFRLGLVLSNIYELSYSEAKAFIVVDNEDHTITVTCNG